MLACSHNQFLVHWTVHSSNPHIWRERHYGLPCQRPYRSPDRWYLWLFLCPLTRIYHHKKMTRLVRHNLPLVKPYYYATSPPPLPSALAQVPGGSSPRSPAQRWGWLPWIILYTLLKNRWYIVFSLVTMDFTRPSWLSKYHHVAWWLRQVPSSLGQKNTGQ